MFKSEHMPASKLWDLLKRIRAEKQQGELRISFSQGSPRGTIVWRQQQNYVVDPPLDNSAKVCAK